MSMQDPEFNQYIANICVDAEESADSNNPERKLIAHILERAILDLKHTDQNVRKDAEEWFFEKPEEDYIFSYESVCAHLELDPELVQKSILKWLEALKAKASQAS